MPRKPSDTQHKIAAVYKELVKSARNPGSPITVTSVVKLAGVDRKTFYNYFDNIEDLVIWIFRDAVANMLEDPQFDLAELDYPDRDTPDKYPSLPCYARFRLSDGMLNQRKFFKALCSTLEADRDYYQKIFPEPRFLFLYRYMLTLYMPLIRKDILIIAGEDRQLPTIPLDFLAEYHTMGIFGRVRYHFAMTKKEMSQKELQPFWNYAHEVIRITLDAMFEEENHSKDMERSFFKMASKTRLKYTNQFS